MRCRNHYWLLQRNSSHKGRQQKIALLISWGNQLLHPTKNIQQEESLLQKSRYLVKWFLDSSDIWWSAQVLHNWRMRILWSNFSRKNSFYSGLVAECPACNQWISVQGLIGYLGRSVIWTPVTNLQSQCSTNVPWEQKKIFGEKYSNFISQGPKSTLETSVRFLQQQYISLRAFRAVEQMALLSKIHFTK